MAIPEIRPPTAGLPTACPFKTTEGPSGFQFFSPAITGPGRNRARRAAAWPRAAAAARSLYSLMRSSQKFRLPFAKTSSPWPGCHLLLNVAFDCAAVGGCAVGFGSSRETNSVYADSTIGMNHFRGPLSLGYNSSCWDSLCLPFLFKGTRPAFVDFGRRAPPRLSRVTRPFLFFGDIG